MPRMIWWTSFAAGFNVKIYIGNNARTLKNQEIQAAIAVMVGTCNLNYLQLSGLYLAVEENCC